MPRNLLHQNNLSNSRWEIVMSQAKAPEAFSIVVRDPEECIELIDMIRKFYRKEPTRWNQTLREKLFTHLHDFTEEVTPSGK